MFSRPLLGTDKQKTKLSWFEYIVFSCIQQGWMNCWYAFQNWADLMGNNYEGYGILAIDDDLEQCILCFWDSLEDDIYPKDFLDELMQIADDVRTGKEELIPMDQVMGRLKDLTCDMIDDVDLNEELDD